MCATQSQLEMPENFYLPAHGRTSNWYVRLVPPAALKGQPGVREFRKSTGTSDRRRAKTIGARLIAEKRAEWDQLLTKTKAPGAGPQVLTAELVEHICACRLYHWMRVDDLGRLEGQGHADQSHAALTQLCQATDKSMRSVLARGRAAPEWARTMDVLDFWCEQMDKPVSRTDPLYPQLVRQFAEVELEATGRVLRRNQGEPAATPEVPSPVGACLSAMTELYRDYKRQHSGGKHTGTSVHVWAKLIDHLGDVPLSSVKAPDCWRRPKIEPLMKVVPTEN